MENGLKQQELKSKATSGVIWTSFQRFSKIGIQFLSGIVLARLLTPFDYGCIGMLAIFMTLTETFIDSGFGSALIQKKRPTKEDYSTVFYWNVVIAAVMYALLFWGAPFIAHFYKIPILCDVLRVQGIILFLYAFNIIQSNQLRKQMNFKVLSLVTAATSIIALVVTVIMAYLGFGVWSLVTQNIIIIAIPTVVFWFYSKWRPIWVFSWKSFKELFGFGFYMFLTHLLNTFSTQLQGLLIGKYYNPSVMGYYAKAQGTEKMASQTITQVLTQVTYPLYAEAQDKKELLIRMIKRVSTTVAFISIPLLLLLILVAKPLFVLLYSSRWEDSVPYFQLLCVAGMGSSMNYANVQSIAAIGKSKIMFSWTVIKRLVGITCVIIGLITFGMKGLLLGAIVDAWFAYFVNIGLISRLIGYSWRQQIRDILPIIIATFVSGLAGWAMGNVASSNMYVSGIVSVLVFVAFYVGWMLSIKPESYIFTKSILTPLVAKVLHNRSSNQIK